MDRQQRSKHKVNGNESAKKRDKRGKMFAQIVSSSRLFSHVHLKTE